MKSCTLFSAVAGILAASLAQAVVLYDGSTDVAGPLQRGWLGYGAIPEQNFVSLLPGGTQLTTSANAGIYAGFSNYTASSSFVQPSFPSLSPTTGFTLEFSVRLAAESGSNDRGGFSVILLGNDLRGVELGFHTDSVFALKLNESSLFVRDTTQTATRDMTTSALYRLGIQGTSFTLSSGATTLLSGTTYDYTNWISTLPGGTDPYELPNYIFLGDDSTSASSTSVISYIAVPEPAGLAVAGLAGAALLRRRRQ